MARFIELRDWRARDAGLLDDLLRRRLDIEEVVVLPAGLSGNPSILSSVLRLCYRERGPNDSENDMMIAGKAYTVSDGEMVLTLEPAEEGGYVVTSPLDPELITEAESLDEAFVNARDAADALNESRKKLAKQLADAERSSLGGSP